MINSETQQKYIKNLGVLVLVGTPMKQKSTDFNDGGTAFRYKIHFKLLNNWKKQQTRGAAKFSFDGG